jgi:hypothetical protein
MAGGAYRERRRVAPGSGTVDKEDRMREEVGKAPPRLEERKGASEYFLAFALLHAGCEDEVIEARLDIRILACWCLRCNELRIFGDDPVGTDNGNLEVPTRYLATGGLRKGEPYEVGLC